MASPHSGPCGPCVLCSETAARYTHSDKCTSEELFIIHKHCEKQIRHRCICLPCIKQVRRNMNSLDFHPRWLPKTPRSDKPACSIKNCAVVSFKATNLATPSEIESILDGILVIKDSPVLLCSQHYNTLYQKLNQPDCNYCGTKPKKGESFTRHCPSPEEVCRVLLETTGETVTLTNQSQICHTCYKYLSSTLKEQNKPPDKTINEITIEIFETKQTLFDKSRNTLATLAMLNCALHILEKFKSGEAVLLSATYKDFCEQLEGYTRNDWADKTNPSKRWLLARLHKLLGTALTVKCHHAKYGSVLLPRNCDLVKALTIALGKSHQHEKNKLEEPTATNMSDKNEQLKNVAAYLNTKIHKQAKEILKAYEDTSEYTCVDIQSIMSSQLDTELVQFIRHLTKRVRENHSDVTEGEEATTTRTIREFYCICVLLFCTNNACSMPLHILLTDAIMCHGGSLELVRILNRVGAVASIDTSNRLSTHIVKERLVRGITPELTANTFTVVSIDNIDILQPHALVSTLDKTRSWHGLSAQCVQPLPNSGVLADTERTDIHRITSRKRPAELATTNKTKRRQRTLTELVSSHIDRIADVPEQSQGRQMSPTYSAKNQHQHISLASFEPHAVEQEALQALRNDLFLVMMLKQFKPANSNHLPGIPILLNCLCKESVKAEVSQVAYLEIVSERADSKDTLIKVMGRIHELFIQKLNHKWVVVVGDGKTYDLLQKIKTEYGQTMEWLLPFTGDWHILLNYQKQLMKLYSDAGLAQLAQHAGYRGETLTSLTNCSNFRRTHAFLLQSIEALYRFFINLFTDKACDKEKLSAALTKLNADFFSMVKTEDVYTFEKSCHTVFEQEFPNLYKNFLAYMHSLANKQDTIKFWWRFIDTDCLAYLGLFTALRRRSWDLRTVCIKTMAPIFTVLDCPLYMRLIPQHVYDLQMTMPECVIVHMKNGAFSASLSPTAWHAVALDECHEMCINKDAKLAVIKPSKEKMSHISNYLSFRSKALRNLQDQLFPERKDKKETLPCQLSSRDKAMSINAEAMLRVISAHGLFSSMDENQGLSNFMTGVQATPEQHHDLLSFRAQGEKTTHNYIRVTYLQTSSTKVVARKLKLNTFSTTKARKHRVKLAEHERKISQRYLKRQLAWATKNGIELNKLEGLLEPVSTLSTALISSDGLPYKSQKSSTTKYLHRRYQNNVFLSDLPPGWSPDTVVLEGMFLIQSSPLPSMKTLKEYTLFFIHRHLSTHFEALTVQTIHIIFDSPGSMHESPKEIEQRRRSLSSTITSHNCTPLHNDSPIPDSWGNILNCRKCKQHLTEYLARALLESVPPFLQEEQEFFTNIGVHVYSVDNSGLQEYCLSMYTNADEADLKVWLHCLHSPGPNKLIFSPDTDVYNIGLTSNYTLQTSDVMIQLSATNSEHKFLHLNALINSINTDPDLTGVPPQTRIRAIQALYIATGCDYVSFFAYVGKITFLTTFYQYASFIAGNELPGSIGDEDLTIQTSSFYSFLRLIGCAYFRMHSSAFTVQSPAALYHSMPAENTKVQHEEWIKEIRRTVWQRADQECQNIPSITALELHWFRCIWVLLMWRSATHNEIDLPALDDYGWRHENGQLQIVWETAQTIAKKQQQLQAVFNGCKCKTGCTTKRCKCLKLGSKCGPGCSCTNCGNSLVENKSNTDTHDMEVQEYLDGDSRPECEIEQDSDDEHLHSVDIDEEMAFVFGEDDTD